MSWRWVVDARGDDVKVDRKWLAISLAIAAVFTWAARRFLPAGVAIPLMFAVAVVLIVWDVRSRRQRS